MTALNKSCKFYYSAAALLFCSFILFSCSKDTDDQETAILSVTGFTPQTAMISDTIMISGTAFGTDVNGISISFGGSAPVKAVTVADTKISVEVPADAKAGKIVVSAAGGL